MERSVYDRMNELESRHWWFTARRAIIASLLKPVLAGKTDAAILEAGCGSGGNLAMLSDFGNVDAFEFDDGARHAAKGKSGLDIRFGALPEDVPFGNQRYDLIGLFDVLEHVEADEASLAALSERLGEGGKIIVTVPAFPLLWSTHDERHHHFRRYTRASLSEAAKKAGLKVSHSSYFNTFLFPLAVAARAVKKLTRSKVPDDRLPPAWVNAVLTRVFGFERHLLGHVRMPFGLSLAAVLEKA
ncbi:class I SAM-dependent methyltransferase [Roseovarius sp. E0-M6]|uniref:class I SAM-dependent methyltransferase n=1 Tax=Roseovarius sp. E0-M6 TaxID=3127118 RepID=UPI0030102813